VAWRTRRASWSDWTATSAGHLEQKDTPQREPAGRHGGRGRRGARERRGDHGPAGQQRRRRRHTSDTISCHWPPTRRPAVDCGPVAEEALPCMAAGSMSQSRDKVAGARVFYRGTEPPPPIGPSLPYRTFPNVCPPPQPAQRWGHFWEKCHTPDNSHQMLAFGILDSTRKLQLSSESDWIPKQKTKPNQMLTPVVAPKSAPESSPGKQVVLYPATTNALASLVVCPRRLEPSSWYVTHCIRQGRCLEAGLGWAIPRQAPLLIRHCGAAIPGSPRYPASATIPEEDPPVCSSSQPVRPPSRPFMHPPSGVW